MGDESRHVEPCGCEFVAVDVPDDAWIGQGWRRVSACLMHADRCKICGGLNPGDPSHMRCM